MPEKTKKDEISEKENRANEPEEKQNEDRKNRSYYYDDAYGYEIYDPNDDEEDDD